MQKKPSIRRRQFLTQTSVCLTAGFGYLAHLPGRLEAGTINGDRDVQGLTEADFRQTVGQPYRVTAELHSGTSVTSELILKKTAGESTTSRRSRRPLHVRQNPFFLTFEGREGDRLEQGTYKIEHADFGRFALFLVPQRMDGERRDQHYVAVFG